ncbi:MAG: hypothetical protein R3B70_33525 [Polyangiaceae bacterium]
MKPSLPTGLFTCSGPAAVIWFDEGNYSAGACTTTRHGTAAALKVLGYFD